MAMLNRLYKYVAAALMACVGILALLLGQSKGQQRKRKAKELRRGLDRANREKKNELYVKKVRIRRAIGDINRMFGTKSDDGAASKDS